MGSSPDLYLLAFLHGPKVSYFIVSLQNSLPHAEPPAKLGETGAWQGGSHLRRRPCL